MRFHSLLTASALALPLTACGHVPITTIWALRNLDAATLDPALLRAAIRVPDTLEPAPGGVRLEIGWWRDGEEAKKHEVKFVLQETTQPADTAPLAAERRPGTRVHVYRVDPTDLAGIRAVQAQVRAEKAQSGGHGKVGVGADACRRGEPGRGPVLMTTWLRIDARGDYLPVVVDLDLRSAVTAEKSFDVLVPPCASPDARGGSAAAG
jgi:multidrug efflux pump subunit AcrA (membrane-fusion protein)